MPVLRKYTRGRGRIINESCDGCCIDYMCSALLCMCCCSDECLQNPQGQCGLKEACTAIYSVVIPISVVSILLWLLLRPNNLRPAVDAAVLVRFGLNNATSTLDYDMAVDLSFHNSHRHLDVRYFDLVAVASYGGSRLGPTVDVLPVFVQRPMATSIVRAVFQGSEAINGSFSVLVTVASTFMYKVPFQKAIYYYDHECYISFPAPPHGGEPPAANMLTPGTLCSPTAW